MAQGDGDGVIGARVGSRWGEIGPAEELVEVGAADAYVRRCDLYKSQYLCVWTCSYLWEVKAYSDFSCAALGLSHIGFNPDILLAIVSCCAHVCPGFRFVVPVLEVVSRSLSVVITLFINAHSIMADIRLLYCHSTKKKPLFLS